LIIRFKKHGEYVVELLSREGDKLLPFLEVLKRELLREGKPHFFDESLGIFNLQRVNWCSTLSFFQETT